MSSTPSRTARGIALVLATVLVAVAVSERGIAQSDARPLALKTSINAVMVSLVDHAAHEIWEAASADRLTGSDWQTVEQHAYQLVAAGSLISLEGTGPRDKAWVATPAWREWAGKLTDGGLMALDAVKKGDRQALQAAGRNIVETCFGCHDTFKPEAPTEGLRHVPHYKN